MKVTVIRTRMIGGGYSYDVYVPTSEVPEQCKPDRNGNSHTTILHGSGEYFDYSDATVPAEQRAMPYGWDRYDARMAHDEKAKAEKLSIAQRAFPELAGLDYWPSLWCYPPLPENAPSHEKRLTV